jgi:hypothetical protein
VTGEGGNGGGGGGGSGGGGGLCVLRLSGPEEIGEARSDAPELSERSL